MSVLLATLAAAILSVALLPRSRRPTGSRPLAAIALVTALLCVAATCDVWLSTALADPPASDGASASADGKSKPAAEKPAADAAPLEAPKNWPAGHPLPKVASNCARCHLTAGRELTLAAKDFAHSVHDLQEMSCSDCHGGNTHDDVEAHEPEFGFIGTKLSAHLNKCRECHADVAEPLDAGPHHWDFSKRINTKYPSCVDCHGNHDVGNPPEDFTLNSVCADCHRQFETRFPNIASVVTENDKLWTTIGTLRAKLGTTDHRVPPEFADEVAALRTDTMKLVHASREPSAAEAAALNERAAKVREALTAWLKAQK
ncbi:MAG: cytochrome c3 family protein [Pirellulales bacterium]|nr:cytochrome c3 family protein [Pirellulales bacterium]